VKPPKDEQIPRPKILPVEKIDKPAPAPSDKYRLTVTGTFANIRTGAGNEFSLIATVKQGDKLILLGESGDWYHVRMENGQEGWVNNRFVK
jgi:uncharacterized protein YgiM (DUF1202 family)